MAGDQHQGQAQAVLQATIAKLLKEQAQAGRTLDGKCGDESEVQHQHHCVERGHGAEGPAPSCEVTNQCPKRHAENRSGCYPTENDRCCQSDGVAPNEPRCQAASDGPDTAHAQADDNPRREHPDNVWCQRRGDVGQHQQSQQCA
ncbi:hypothetical protein D3C77_395130 [compost metagenome]